MPYILRPLLSFLLTAAPALVFSSTFEISGKDAVPCFPAREEYSVQGAPNGTGAAVEWHWQVTGGTFAGGGTSLKGTGASIPPAAVDWHPTKRGAGQVRLTVRDGGGTEKTSAKTVHLGLPDPLAIKVEGGYLECGGNWFYAVAEWPLTGTETVEWDVSNGLDGNGRPIGRQALSGEGADRIFARQGDPSLPLIVTARLRPGCGNRRAPSPEVTESFQNPAPRIIAPSRVEAGRENKFRNCACTAGTCLGWASSGAVVGTDEGGATIYFPEPGTYTVRMITEGCDGKVDTLEMEVAVAGPKGSARGQAPPAGGTPFRAFPNPASDGQLYVEALEPPAGGTAELISMQGRAVRSAPLAGRLTTLDTAGLPPGIYIVRVKAPGWGGTARIGVNLSR